MQAHAIIKTLDLFGGSIKWNEHNWTAVDDRVRGGSSQSYMTVDKPTSATFNGNLDTSTLGGAGFASQRTILADNSSPSDDHNNEQRDFLWNLSSYSGILLTNLSSSEKDNKKFTFNLKDEILPRDPDSGREQSSVSWEYDFTVDEEPKNITIPWNAFRATYRGREIKGKTLNLERVRRISIMMRSFFDQQSGDFSLNIGGIAAYKTREDEDEEEDGLENEKLRAQQQQHQHQRNPKAKTNETSKGVAVLSGFWHTLTSCVRGRL